MKSKKSGEVQFYSPKKKRDDYIIMLKKGLMFSKFSQHTCLLKVVFGWLLCGSPDVLFWYLIDSLSRANCNAREQVAIAFTSFSNSEDIVYVMDHVYAFVHYAFISPLRCSILMLLLFSTKMLNFPQKCH